MIALILAMSAIGQQYCPTCPTPTAGPVYVQPPTYGPIVHQGLSTYTYPQHVVYNTPAHVATSQIIENAPPPVATSSVIRYQAKFPVVDPGTLPFSINGFELHVDSNGVSWMRRHIGNTWVYLQQDGTVPMSTPSLSSGSNGASVVANYGVSLAELRDEPREVLTTNDPTVGRLLGAEDRPLSSAPNGQTAFGESTSSTNCPDGKCPTDPKALDPQTLLIAGGLLAAVMLAAVFKRN